MSEICAYAISDFSNAEANGESLDINWKSDTAESYRFAITLPRFWFPWQRKTTLLVAAIKDQNGQVADYATPEQITIVSGRLHLITSITAVALFYLLLASAKHAFYNKGSRNPFRHSGKFLLPAVVSADEYGTASLSNLQLIWFTLIVTGLLVYGLTLNLGLSEMSEAVLGLLGISAGTKVVANSVTTMKQRLGLENWNWLIATHILKCGNEIDPTKRASLRDLVMTDGIIDAYRYQMLIFSILAGVSLILGGYEGLSYYELPDSFVSIFSISNGVYVFGKLVAPDTLKELNEKISTLREDFSTLTPDQQAEAKQSLTRILESIYGTEAVVNPTRKLRL